MIIVLEGCDGTGKSTLAQAMVEEAKGMGITADVWHRGVPERHPLEEYEFDLESRYDAMRTDETKLLVCDRWHLGQAVYGDLYRDKNELGAGGIWHVDAFLRARGALQLVFVPPDDVLQRRIGVRGDGYIRYEDIPVINEAYRALTRQYPMSMLAIDDEDFLDATRIRSIIQGARLFTRDAHPLAAFGSYVGPHEPEILLLGEKRAETRTGRRAAHLTQRASFVPYGGTSGQWLCDTIVHTELQTHEIGLANALEEDLPALFTALGEPQVVTLGKAAHLYLEERYTTHGAVPHPQYMRRFRNNDQERYAEAIIEAATLNYEVEV
jgi:thymidylate kinase